MYEECGVDEKWKLYDGTPIQKDEESCHIFQFFSVDNLDNVEELNANCFFVDEKHPITEKEYGEPFFENETSEWINSQTPVELSAYDQQPHPAGVNQTWWRNALIQNDEACRNEQLCQTLEGSGNFNTYLEPFYKPGESCHLIEYYSVDNV